MSDCFGRLSLSVLIIERSRTPFFLVEDKFPSSRVKATKRVLLRRSAFCRFPCVVQRAETVGNDLG